MACAVTQGHRARNIRPDNQLGVVGYWLGFATSPFANRRMTAEWRPPVAEPLPVAMPLSSQDSAPLACPLASAGLPPFASRWFYADQARHMAPRRHSTGPSMAIRFAFGWG